MFRGFLYKEKGSAEVRGVCDRRNRSVEKIKRIEQTILVVLTFQIFEYESMFGCRCGFVLAVVRRGSVETNDDEQRPIPPGGGGERYCKIPMRNRCDLFRVEAVGWRLLGH